MPSAIGPFWIPSHTGHWTVLSVEGMNLNADGLYVSVVAAQPIIGYIIRKGQQSRFLTRDVRPVTAHVVNEVQVAQQHEAQLITLKHALAGGQHLNNIAFSASTHVHLLSTEKSEAWDGYYVIRGAVNDVDGYEEQLVSMDLGSVMLTTGAGLTRTLVP